ncbi:OmpA family protein [Mariniflexile ostreae]|uniref:OmpA family protein n=1 Tax=Mariniflexile ostreae TaxID=1520892 RepID=A0ABV5FCG0_9FLAO
MKKSAIIYGPLLLVLIFSNMALVHGQNRVLEEATEKYKLLDFINAQKIYLKVAEKGYQSEELFSKLGNSYYFNAQYDQAVKWYEKLFKLNEYPENEMVLLRYSQALKATGNLNQAKTYYNRFVEKTGLESNIRYAKNYEALILQNSGRYQMDTLKNVYDESKISFGHFKLKNTLYYASTNHSKGFLNKKSSWDGLSFLSLYTIALDSLNHAIGSAKKLKGVNSKFHESSPVFTADNNTMYFTRSNTTYKNKKNNQNLKIYKLEKKENTWQKAEELSINSDYFSTAHPALSPDGTKLYFSSDRPGGFGASDIYVSEILADGSLGEPINLGSEINTSAKETFPFVSTNNELYFSSDGHFGLGGLDVYYVKIKDAGFGNLLNVGAPINSYADDFAFGIDSDTGRGFMSSNRSSQAGAFIYDNIYSFVETQPIIDVFYAQIQGVVTDKKTGLPIEGANVILMDSEKIVYKEVQTNNKGHYTVETDRFETYFMQAKIKNYDVEEFIAQPNLDHQNINFPLQRNEMALTPGTDLAKVLNIPMIYFDFDKFNIRTDAQVELEKILTVLNTYPSLKLEIRAHTDSRGHDAYNKVLSQQRANATVAYMVDHGIAKIRLEAVGMGETKPVNDCINNIPCLELQHQENRRSEFIIID